MYCVDKGCVKEKLEQSEHINSEKLCFREEWGNFIIELYLNGTSALLTFPLKDGDIYISECVLERHSKLYGVDLMDCIKP